MIMYIPQAEIFVCFLVASNALAYCTEKCENVIKLIASLKSEVFLPCAFDTVLGNNTVRWSHFSSLLKITHNGNIVFDNPREGRVTVFPNLANEGNFSILIYDLQTSDLGTYCCETNRECWRVVITESARPADKKNPWIYFAAGAGLFILLFIAFYLFLKFCENWQIRSSNSNSVNGAQSEVTDMQQRQNPQRVFRTVPEPTTSQQLNSKPYYVNQMELFIPNNAGQKRKKQKHYQFKNPIYWD